MKMLKLILPCLLITLSSLSTTLDAIDETKLLPSDAQPGAWFGYKVTIDGNAAIVSAPEVSANDSGQVYFFEHEESGWVQKARFHPPGPGVGYDVDLDGNIGIVGTYKSERVVLPRKSGHLGIKKKGSGRCHKRNLYTPKSFEVTPSICLSVAPER